jgi:tripartite-type tricarboxylate transporter receptor subunit TctC
LEKVMLRWKYRVAANALAVAMCSISAAQAQTSRPIRVVSPFATASVSDLTLRLVGERLGSRLNTTVVVENMPTGGGIAAASAVLTARADGNTLALLSNATAVTVATFKSLPFDPVRDFVPVSGISQFAYLVLASQKSGLRSFRDFIAAARAKPGALNVGTAAPGTTPYFTALLLKREAGIDFAIIPFKGATDLTVAILRNDIEVFINAYGAVKDNLRQNQLRAIASTTAERFKLLPDVPTVQEEGVPGFEAASWNGLFAPTGTPAAVVARIGEQMRASLAEPEIAKKLLDLGVEVWAGSPQQLSARLRAEIVRWNRVVQEAGIEKN